MSTTLTAASKVLSRRIKNRRLPHLTVPQTGQAELDRTLKNITEHLRMYEGASGAPRQRFITIEDLENAGLVSITEKQGFAAITKVLGSDTPTSVSSKPAQQIVLSIDSQNINNLDGIGNVETGSKKTNDFLYWDGSNWIPRALFGAQNTWKARQYFQEGVIELQERADAPSAQAGRGYIWLDDAAPNVLKFTNDAGTTITIGTGGSGLTDVIDDTSPQFNNDLNLITGADLYIWDAGDTDNVSFAHDGTDFTITGVNTGDILVTGLTSMRVAGNIAANFGGDIIYMYHDGTRGILMTNNLTGGQLWFNADAGSEAVCISSGSSFRVMNNGNTDYLDFSHDGTDANIAGTNTTDINITGIAGFNVVNYSFDVDQTVGASQDNYVLTYDDTSGLISLEAAAGGGGGGGFNSGIVTVHEGNTLSTYSNQPSSGNWWQGNNRYRYKMDLSDATSIRLILQVSVASASVNTPVAQVRYATSLPVNYAATSAIGSGATECEVSLATGSIFVDSGWITLTAAAAVDNVYLAFCGLGGDATADPAVANTLIMWK